METEERRGTINSKRGRRRFIGMRLIVTVVAAMLISAAVLSLGLLSERQSRATLNTEIQTRLLLTARNLALSSSAALLSEFPELTLHPLVKEMQSEQQALELMVVLDHDNAIQGHAQVERLGLTFDELPDLRHLGGNSLLAAGESMRGNDELLVAEAPVLHPGGEPIGRALVGQQSSYADELVAARRAEQILLVGLVLGLSLALLLLLMSKLLKPVSVLAAGIERIGRGDLDTPVDLTGRTEFTLLGEAVNEMANELKAAYSERMEKERMTRELGLAREIQSSLLPEGDLSLAGFHLRGAHRAAAEVGGDYYDYFPLPDNKLGLAIADVSGKGLAGCMIMSMLSALLRSHVDRYDSPRELLLALDRQLGSTLKTGQFVTMFYGILDPVSGELCYASAAHCPMLICRSGGELEWRSTKGIPLGAISTEALAGTLVEENLQLKPGDHLIQYTDGISEAFNPDGEQFELEGIERSVRANLGEGGAGILKGLEEAVGRWSVSGLPSDDETLLVLSADGEAQLDRMLTSDEVLDLIVRARRDGRHLKLVASLESLTTLDDWFPGCAGVENLGQDESHLLLTGLYEAVANVAEHAYGLDSDQSFDLWWVPGNEFLARGYFLILDQGNTFEVRDQVPSDFSDPAVRLRGRGIGLDIIRGISSRFDYFPSTAAGNVTLLAFDPEQSTKTKEPSHV